MAQRKTPHGKPAPAKRPAGARPATGRPAAERPASARPAAARPAAQRPGGKASTKPRKPGRSIVNQRQTPWALIVTAVVIVVFAIAIVGYVVLRGHHSSSSSAGAQIIPSTPTGTTTKQQTPKQVADTSGIPGVLAWDTQGWPGDGSSHPGAVEHQHVDGPVVYAVTPPIGGPHNATWMNAGVYTRPIPNERAVHNLEHGAVWITYDPNLPSSEVATLTAFVGKQSMISESAQAEGGSTGQANRYMDLSPWPTNTLPSPIVLSAWGRQLRISSPTDPRMQRFVDTFRHNQKYTPEYGAAVDGIPVQTGGRPAEFGSAKANPAGSAS